MPEQNLQPPQPPPFDRRIRFLPMQMVGVPLLSLLPVLALFGVFGETFATQQASNEALVREDFSLTNGLIGVCTLFGLTYFTSLVMHSSKRAEEAITGAPVVLVHRGKLIEDALNDERVSPEEVFGEMHKAGVDRLEQVRWAVLESDGRIAIVPEQQQDKGHQSAVAQREAM